MKLVIIINIIFFLSLGSLAKETWILDKELSTIKFEIPVLLANNVKGEFNKIEGFIVIDTDSKENNKAIFSVDIKSIDMNYKKYKPLLLSMIFFNAKEYPLALVDTKKFSYKNQNKLKFDVELNIKGIVNYVPLELEILHLTEELVQIKGKLSFSRNSFEIGTGKWSSTKILKDKALIETNLFLFKE